MHVKIAFNQFESRKGLILLFLCRCVYRNEHGENEVRHKIVHVCLQSQGYKSISRDLDVPFSTIHNVIKKSKAHASVANFLDVATRENLMENCSEGLLEWWRKHLDQLPQRFKLTFRHTVRLFQPAPSVASSMTG